MVTTTKAPRKATKPKPAAKPSMKLVNKDDNESHIRKMIAEAAYFRAQKRNFQGGDSTRDWLEAEKEIRLIR